MLDFNHRQTAAERVMELVDIGMVAAHAKEKKRAYLGASLVGESCLRRIQYQYFDTPRDELKPMTGQNLRILQRGHALEPAMARWLREAGFDLRTEDEQGKQYGFSLAGGKIQGHADGVIVGGPEGFAYPMLWENKAVGIKSWKELAKSRLALAKPVYAAQVALYQTYLGLYENPALFTAINCDMMEIYVELVSYDAALAQSASDKAVHIIQACEAGELLPRVTADPTWYECRYCPWAERCWRAA